MAGTKPSFWPDDINVGILTPREILETQAKTLEELTQGLVTAEVVESPPQEDGAVLLQMNLVAPNLGYYKRQILTARYTTDAVYPTQVDADCFRDAVSSLKLEKATRRDWPDGPVAYTDREAGLLFRYVMRSGPVKAALASLIAKSREMLRSLGKNVPEEEAGEE